MNASDWVHESLFSKMFHRISLQIRTVGYMRIYFPECSTEFLFSCGNFINFFASVPNAAHFPENSMEHFIKKPPVYPTQSALPKILWNISSRNL